MIAARAFFKGYIFTSEITNPAFLCVVDKTGESLQKTEKYKFGLNSGDYKNVGLVANSAGGLWKLGRLASHSISVCITQ